MDDVSTFSKASQLLLRMSTTHVDDALLPNRKSFPWAPLPHPLVQASNVHRVEGQMTMAFHTAVFHESLMALMRDHTIEGRTLFPGAGFVEMALAVASQHGGGSDGSMKAAGGVALHDVSFVAPLDLKVGVELVCQLSDDERMEFVRRDQGDGDHVCCTVGRAVGMQGRGEGASGGGGGAVALEEPPSLPVMQARCTEEVGSVAERYVELARRGYHGPQFQTVSRAWRSVSI